MTKLITINLSYYNQPKHVLLKHIENALSKSIIYTEVKHPDSYPLDEPQRRCPDIRKANLQLNYNPKVDLNDGIRRYFSWTETVYTGKRH